MSILVCYTSISNWPHVVECPTGTISAAFMYFKFLATESTIFTDIPASCLAQAPLETVLLFLSSESLKLSSNSTSQTAFFCLIYCLSTRCDAGRLGMWMSKNFYAFCLNFSSFNQSCNWELLNFYTIKLHKPALHSEGNSKPIFKDFCHFKYYSINTAWVGTYLSIIMIFGKKLSFLWHHELIKWGCWRFYYLISLSKGRHCCNATAIKVAINLTKMKNCINTNTFPITRV